MVNGITKCLDDERKLGVACSSIAKNLFTAWMPLLKEELMKTYM